MKFPRLSTTMAAQVKCEQNVTLPLHDYNELYEQAYFNEKKAALEKERRALEDARKTQEEAMRQKEQRLEQSRARGEKERRGAITSQNWLLVGHKVNGIHEPVHSLQDNDSAVFNFELEFQVFDSEWTCIPLVDGQMITCDWAVQRMASEEIPTSDTKSDWNTVSLGSDTMLLVQELDGSPGRQVLGTNIPGRYRVSFKAYIFVHSVPARNLHSLCLNLLHPVTTADLKLKHDTAARVSIRDLSITPATRFSLEEDNDFLKVALCLPPTKTVEIKWRGVETSDLEWERACVDGEKSVEEDPLQITASHDSLHTIMDGVLQSNHALKLCVDSEQRALSRVRFAISGPSRITSVSGHGVTCWRASPLDGSAEPGTMVEVDFKSSLISDNIIVLLNTELEISSDAFTIPSLICEGVLRQTGNLAVVKMANVEVHEHDARGMAKVSPDELPAELTCQTTRPIMFAYKYLSPQTQAKFRIVQHDQVDVLDAVVETALYEVLMSESQSMHRLMLNMTNSRQQYLEIQGIPADARLWSLLVNSKPAKPVRGENGNLLIPLLIGARSNRDEGAQSASVELAYLVQQDPLGSEGSISLTPPRLDVPISKLLVELQWPEVHELKFTGSIQPVRAFSYSLPKPVNHDVGTDVVELGFDFNKAPAYMPKAGVNVKIPRAGKSRRFEQLLVVDGGATLVVDYHTKVIEPQAECSWPASMFKQLCSRRR